MEQKATTNQAAMLQRLSKLAIVAALSFSPAAVFAAPITGLFATGVDGAGNALGDGASDPHYQITNVGGTPQAIVINQANIPGNWFPNAATHRWVWETATGQPTNVTRIFRTTFDLTDLDPETAFISGQWATDNFGSISLNGVATGNSCFGFISLCNFSISGGFSTGLNLLDFSVTDTGGISGFLVANISGTADRLSQQEPPIGTPEPGMLALFGLGLLGIRHFRRRAHS